MVQKGASAPLCRPSTASGPWRLYGPRGSAGSSWWVHTSAPRGNKGQISRSHVTNYSPRNVFGSDTLSAETPTPTVGISATLL